MSKLVIKYLNKQIIEKDVTGIEICTDKTFLWYEIGERTVYIPLMNIAEIEIKGANQIK